MPVESKSAPEIPGDVPSYSAPISTSSMILHEIHLGDYSFLVRGVLLSKKQEAKLKLRDVASVFRIQTRSQRLEVPLVGTSASLSTAITPSFQPSSFFGSHPSTHHSKDGGQLVSPLSADGAPICSPSSPSRLAQSLQKQRYPNDVPTHSPSSAHHPGLPSQDSIPLGSHLPLPTQGGTFAPDSQPYSYPRSTPSVHVEGSPFPTALSIDPSLTSHTRAPPSAASAIVSPYITGITTSPSAYSSTSSSTNTSSSSSSAISSSSPPRIPEVDFLRAITLGTDSVGSSDSLPGLPVATTADSAVDRVMPSSLLSTPIVAGSRSTSGGDLPTGALGVESSGGVNHGGRSGSGDGHDDIQMGITSGLVHMPDYTAGMVEDEARQYVTT